MALHAVCFIYALTEPSSGEVRYVGKANDPRRRLRGHLNPFQLRKRSHKNSWLKSLLARGLEPGLVVLETVSHLDWREAERRWIAHYRSPRLLNETAGGDGMHDPSPELRERWRASLRGRAAWNKGIKYTPAQCATNARAMLGRPGYWTGKKLSPEHVAKLSERKRGKPSWIKGLHHRPETREKLSRDWVVTDPNGFVYSVRNLKEFCRVHGLRDSLLHHVATGKRPHHKGWTCRRA